MKKLTHILLAAFMFITGGMIYLFFRSDTLILFRWCRLLRLDNLVNSMRESQVANLELPNWIVFNLPDGLWLLAYLLVVDVVWGFRLSCQSVLWLSVLPVVAIGSEVLQHFNIVIGTFDPLDLISYSLSVIVFKIKKMWI